MGDRTRTSAWAAWFQGPFRLAAMIVAAMQLWWIIGHGWEEVWLRLGLAPAGAGLVVQCLANLATGRGWRLGWSAAIGLGLILVSLVFLAPAADRPVTVARALTDSPGLPPTLLAQLDAKGVLSAEQANQSTRSAESWFWDRVRGSLAANPTPLILAALAATMTLSLPLLLPGRTGRKRRWGWLLFAASAVALIGLLALHLTMFHREHGLSAQYYLDDQWTKKPGFTTLFQAYKPGVRIDRTIDFDANSFDMGTGLKAPLSIRWTGWLHLSPAGPVRLALRTAGWAELIVDGRSILKTGPQRAYAGLTETSSRLAAGFHQVELKYAYSAGPLPGLTWLWSRGDDELRPIPATALFPNTSPNKPDQGRLTRDAIYGYVHLLVCGLVILAWSAYLVWLVGAAARRRPTIDWDLVVFLGAVVGAGFLFHLAFLYDAQFTKDFEILTWGSDHASYFARGRYLLAGLWPSQWHQEFYAGPGQSFFLALVQALVGRDPTAVRLVMIVFSSLTPLLVHRLAGLAFGPRMAKTAAMITFLCALFIFYAPSLMIASGLTLALIGIGVYLMRFSRSGSRADLIKAGWLFGLSILLRGSLPLVGAGVGLWLAWRRRLKIGPTVRDGLCLLLPVLFWAFWPISWNAGWWNLAWDLGGGRPFYGISSNGPTTLFDSNVFEPRAAREARARVKKGQSGYLAEIVRFAQERPTEFREFQRRKVVHFFNGWESHQNVGFHEGQAVSPLLRSGLLTFTVIGPLGLVGLILSLSRWREERVRLIWIIILTYLIAVLIAHVEGRFRLPIVPYFIVSGAYALVWASRSAARLLAVGAMFLALAILCNADVVIPLSAYPLDFLKLHLIHFRPPLGY